MSHEETQEQILDLIDNHKWQEIKQLALSLPVAELADLLMEMDKSQQVLFFRALSNEIASEVFTYLDPPQQNSLLINLSDEETRQLLAVLEPDDQASLLTELPSEITKRLINLLSTEDLQEVRQLLGYPEESVGRFMTPDYVAVRPQWKIEKALQHIREMGQKVETINVIYITDDQGKLLDALKLQDFIIADPLKTVQSIMDYTYVSLSAFDDRELAVRTMQRSDKSSLPVLSSDGVLVGLVTFDDVLEVAEEETTEDFQKEASVLPLDMSYRDASSRILYSKRVLWLMVLVVVNIFSSGIIAMHEEILESTIALAFFIPLLIDSGGNVGAQSSTLVIRAIATGDLRVQEWLKTLLKEISVGVLLGISMGIATFFLGIIRGGMLVGVVVGLTMISIVLVTNLIGMTLPFVLSRLKIDPAIASSPLITTLADIAGLFLYFLIASWILGPTITA